MSWTAPQGRSIVKGFVWIVTGDGEQHLGDIWGLTYRKKGVKINVEEAQWSKEEFSMIGIRKRKSESWKLEKKNLTTWKNMIAKCLSKNMNKCQHERIDVKENWSKASIQPRKVFIHKKANFYK